MKAGPWRAWPSVWCGGPAEPRGAPSLTVEVEVKTVSEGNTRSSKAVIGRKKKQRDAVEASLSCSPASDDLGVLYDLGGPWCVRLTRLSVHCLDRDNLAASMKAVTDAVAFALGVDDGDPAFGVTWVQEVRQGPAGVRIEVWGPGALP